jgi:hypothetical protein
MARRPGAVATGRPNVVPRVSAKPTAWEREQVRQTAVRERREAQERRLKLAAESQEARRARGGAARVDAPDPLVVPTGSGSAPGWAQPMPY